MRLKWEATLPSPISHFHPWTAAHSMQEDVSVDLHWTSLNLCSCPAWMEGEWDDAFQPPCCVTVCLEHLWNYRIRVCPNAEVMPGPKVREQFPTTTMISGLQRRTKIVIALMLGSFALLQCGKIPFHYILVSGPGSSQKFGSASYDWRTGYSSMHTSNHHPSWERWSKPLPNSLPICPIYFKWYFLEVFSIL